MKSHWLTFAADFICALPRATGCYQTGALLRTMPPRAAQLSGQSARKHERRREGSSRSDFTHQRDRPSSAIAGSREAPTPISNMELTGLWSLIFRAMWLR